MRYYNISGFMQCFFGFVTFCVVFVAGILGAFTARDLYRLTAAGSFNSELSPDLFNKVVSLRSVITGLVVRYACLLLLFFRLICSCII